MAEPEKSLEIRIGEILDKSENETRQYFTDVVKKVYGSRDIAAIERLNYAARTMYDNAMKGNLAGLLATKEEPVKTAAVAEPVKADDSSGNRISYKQAQNLWAESDKDARVRAVSPSGYRLRIQGGVSHGKIKAKKENKRIVYVDKDSLVKYIENYRKSDESPAREPIGQEESPKGRYISIRDAWKQLKAAEVAAGSRKVSNSAYFQRVKYAISKGTLPSKGSGRKVKVHRETFSKLKKNMLKLPEARKVEFSTIIDGMTGKDDSEIDSVLRELGIRGRSFAAYKGLFRRYVVNKRNVNPQSPEQSATGS